MLFLSDVYITCDDNIYNIIEYPAPQNHHLSGNRNIYA